MFKLFKVNRCTTERYQVSYVCSTKPPVQLVTKPQTEQVGCVKTFEYYSTSLQLVII